MESLICTICVYSDFFLVCQLYSSGLQIMLLISDHLTLDLWPVLILEVFSSWDIKKGQFQFLLTFLVVFFWSVNCTNQVCIPSHTLNMGNILSEGFWYLVFLFLAFLSILSLLFLAVFPDLEMLQFWSVNYICLVCKLYYNFGHFQNFGQYLYECFWTIFECF